MTELARRVHAARVQIAGVACDECSSGARCGRPGEYLAEIPGLGRGVVCRGCARFYARGLVRRLRLTPDAWIAAGNVLDQLEHLLEGEGTDESGTGGGGS